MAEEIRCISCGKSFAGTVCPDCGEISRLNLLPSLPFITFVFGLFLLIGFSGTRVAVQAFNARQASIAQSWQQQGMIDLHNGESENAIEDFENALVYDRENSDYRLQLSTALVQAGRFEEAQSHLGSLWEERPGDSNVNLQLARLDARRGNLSGAERYYEGAIYGVWPTSENPYEQRLKVRMEFARLLITSKRQEQALGQLAALATETRSSGAERKQLGDLYMQAGAPKQAFQQYMMARTNLRSSPKGYELELAQAAFAQNDFALADRWATAAVKEGPESQVAQEFAKTTRQILESDPYQSGIGELRRAERVVAAFQTADKRMGQCFPTYTLGPHSREEVLGKPGANGKGPATLNTAAVNQVMNYSSWAQQLRPWMQAKQMRHRDDVEENAMRFVFQTERFAAKNCTLPTSPEDNALLSLSRERWSND